MTKNEKFIEKAKLKHGDKYDYSKVEYINAKTKICIVCPKHGEFFQIPDDHLHGSNCPKCANLHGANIRTNNTEYFTKKAKEIHKGKYNYSKVKYINNKTKVCIICPEHGEFWQTPREHLSGSKCPFCSKNRKMSTIEFVNKAIGIHGQRYDYSKVNYINTGTKVCIICPEHGEFWQTPENHLQGFKCGKCSKNYMDGDYFIELSKLKHKKRYDYSKLVYLNIFTNVIITCPIHGDFSQRPADHLRGHGCQLCSESKGEKTIGEILFNRNISFVRNYKFNNCKDKRKLPFDFYLPNYNICIEYDGIQHFAPIERFGGVKELESIQKRDQIKTDYCAKNNIKLIRIPYTEFNNIENILKEQLNYEA